VEPAKQARTRSFARWIAVVAWMVFVFYLSAQSSLPMLSSLFGSLQSFGGHFLEYVILALLLRWALNGTGVARAGRWAFVFAVAYGLTDEFHQHFVPGRHMDPFDLLTDAAGAAVALWLAGRVAARLTGGRLEKGRQPTELG
jgi:VanZ family protein